MKIQELFHHIQSVLNKPPYNEYKKKSHTTASRTLSNQSHNKQVSQGLLTIIRRGADTCQQNLQYTVGVLPVMTAMSLKNRTLPARSTLLFVCLSLVLFQLGQTYLPQTQPMDTHSSRPIIMRPQPPQYMSISCSQYTPDWKTSRCKI